MAEDVMLDINGKPVTVGAHVMFRGRGTWLRGTVRDVVKQQYSRRRGGPVVRWEARVDDGDSTSDDHRTNHWSCLAWVCSKQIKVRVPHG